MPWCPKCKTEYREGMEVCADCKSRLVKSLGEEDVVAASCSLLFGDEKQVRMIEAHLLKEGIRSAFVTETDKSRETGKTVPGQAGKNYELFVSEEEKDAAVKCAAEFMRNTNPQAEEAMENPESPRGATMARPATGKEFKSAKERKSELKSSGIMLLAFGVAGVVFMLLVIFQIIPMRFVGFNAVIAYSVMGIFFGALLISGVLSLRSAKAVGTEDDEEAKQLEELNAWCEKNLSKESIEERFPETEEDAEQVYFVRMEYMKATLAQNFPDLKGDFAEYFLEEKYNQYFE